MKQFLLILFLLCIIHGGMFASNDEDTIRTVEHHATLSVQSNISGAQVYIDTLFAGVTPLEQRVLEEGTHIVRYVYPDSRSWNHTAIIETLAVRSVEAIHRRIIFPVVYHITSEPYGATVHLNDSLIGTTPLFCAFTPVKGMITLSKEGYAEATVTLSADGGDVYALLHRNTQEMNGERSPFLSDGGTKNMRPVILTAGAAVLTGAASAYFKIKADGYYNDYRVNGDPGTLDRVRRLDTAAGITLFASEMSLLALSYLLLSR
jgi:hypothetical protein